MRSLQPAQESFLTIAQISILNSVMVVFIVALAIATVSLLIAAIRSTPQGHKSWLDYGSFFVVICGIAAVIIGFLSILLLLGRFVNVTQALGFLTAFFGAVVGLVGTFFGIRSSADATAGAQKLAAASGDDTTPPQVVSTNPRDRAPDVSPNIHPTAAFSKDMDSVTINPNTFKVLDQDTLKQVPAAVPNGVHYDETAKVATFTPTNPLESGKVYEATITSGVKDKSGNTLAQDKTWHFTVAKRHQPAAEEPAAEEPEAVEDAGEGSHRQQSDS